MEYELDDELRGVIDHEVRVRGGRCEKPCSQMLALSSRRVWMTTTDYSRQSSGTLAGSQPVSVVNDVFTRCTLNLGDHADLMPKPWRSCRLDA